jgi:hypothetical protein
MKKYYIPPNAPPPICPNIYLKRTQKDSSEVETSAKITFDDIESGVAILPHRTRQGDSSIVISAPAGTFDDWEDVPKRQKIVRQGDSINTKVNKTVNTPVAYIPLYNDTPKRAIAPLPENFQNNPHAINLGECPDELKTGMNALKPISVSVDPNQILECHSYR